MYVSAARNLYVVSTIIIMLGGLVHYVSGADPVPIYGEDSQPVGLTIESQKIIVGILIIMIFALLVMELFKPEVLLFATLIVCIVLQILTLPEALSGNTFTNRFSSCPNDYV